MRNTFDIVDILFLELKKDPAIAAAISGKTYKYSRPLNSDKQDIVIKSLPVTSQQIQRGVANVNIHVPNLKLKINGVQDNSQPDAATLKIVTSLVIVQLTDKVFGDYWFDVQQQNIMRDETSDEHFSNIRVNFYFENI